MLESDLVPAVSKFVRVLSEVMPAEMQRQGGRSVAEHRDSHRWSHALVAGGRRPFHLLTLLEAGGGRGRLSDCFTVGAHELLLILETGSGSSSR